MAAPASSTLAALLQRHRTAAGLTQEELAQRARLSARAISDLERGLKRRPHAYTVQRLVAALELAGPDRAEFEMIARLLTAASLEGDLDGAGAMPHCGESAHPRPRNPYKGLRPFRSDDAGDYFGPESLIAALVSSIGTWKEYDPRFLALVGPSGSGKSSVVMAGLMPRLQSGAISGSDLWVYPDPMQPGAHPLESLTLALATALPGSSLTSIRADLDHSTRGLHLLASRTARKPGTYVVLVVDQFEELFTLAIDERERQHFVDLLTMAAMEMRGPTLIILTLRADFYDRPMRYGCLGALMEGHSKSMLPMSLPDLRRAIEEPASLPDVQLTFQQDLVGDLLYEVRDQAGTLPLLSFTLEQLFERREGRRVTVAAFQELGGVHGALARRAEALYDGLPSEQHQRLARVLFLRLIDAGELEQAITRRRVISAELLLPDADQTTALQEVADAFIVGRLLTTNVVTATTTIEVSHEALITAWPRLADWLRAARDDVRLQRTLSADALEWERHGRPADHLYRGSMLDAALQWAERNTPSAMETVFLHSAVDARRRQELAERQQQERELALAHRVATASRLATHRLRYLAGMLVLFLAIASGLALVAVNAAKTATASEKRESAAKGAAIAQRNLALSSKLALLAVSHLDDQNTLALLLSVEANHLASTVEARGALLESFQHQHNRLIAVLHGDPAGEMSVHFSGDGGRVNAVSFGGVVQQWDAATLRQHVPLDTAPVTAGGHTASASSADGNLVAYSTGGVSEVWDLRHRRHVGNFSADNSGDTVTALAFSRDNTILAAAYASDTIRLWHVAQHHLMGTFFTGQQAQPSSIHINANSISFSPDGRILALGGSDGSVALWDVADRRAIGTPLVADPLNQVFCVAFSPNGAILASASANGGVQLWDVAHRQPLGRALTHRPPGVYSVAFSHDGSILASANVDGTIQLWNVSIDQPLGAPLVGHQDTVTDLFDKNGLTDLAFSPDDSLLASGGQYGTVSIWDVAHSHSLGVVLPGTVNAVAGVALSADGTTAATAGANKTVLLWDLVKYRLRCNPLAGHTDLVNTVAFSPNGRIVASGADDATIRLWDVARCRPLGAPLRDPAGVAVESLVFSPNGRLLVAGNADATIRVWDVDRRRVSGPALLGPTARAWDVAISRDGREVASGNLDGSVWLWNVSAGHLHAALLTGHADAVYSVAFSPDDRMLASGSNDGTIRLWDTATKRQTGAPIGGDAAVRSVAFSPDGTILASAGDDETIRLWDVATQLSVGPPLTGHTGRVWGVAFAQNGKTLVSVGVDQTLRLWNIDPAVLEARVCRLSGRNFTHGEWQHYLGDLPYQQTCAAYP